MGVVRSGERIKFLPFLIMIATLALYFSSCNGGGSSPQAPAPSPTLNAAPPSSGSLSANPKPPSIPLGIISVAPGAGAAGAVNNTLPAAKFNKAIDPATLTNQTFFLSAPDQANIAGTVSYDPNTFTVFFSPLSPLLGGVTYTGTMSGSITDLSGQPLGRDYVWSFTTAQSDPGLPPPPLCPERTRLPYVAFDTPTSVTLAWECAPEGVVKWGTEGTENAQIADNLLPRNKHFLTLSNLAPNTTYRYDVTVKEVELGGGTFRTAQGPEANQFSFIVFADSGRGTPAQLALASVMEKLDFSFAIIPGDVVYDKGADPDFDPRYFGPYKNLINHIPFFPVVGNHDIVADQGATFMANFFHPLGNLYYDFHWGETHFIALNSNTPYDPAQLAWLDQTLAQSQARWKIVYFHHPPFNSGIYGNNLDTRRAFVPLFEKYHVDAVFSGHAHDYERITPINGVAYFVAGGGGAELSPAPGKSLFTAVSKSTYHLLVATMSADALTIDAIDSTGTPFDSVTLTK